MSGLRRRHGMRIWRLADLTPLVDVALVLVVFLLLSARLVEDSSLPVELPRAESAQGEQDGDLTVTVLAAGGVVVDGQTLDLEALGERASGHDTVVLRADRGCEWGLLVEVQDRLRAAGVQRVLAAVRQGDGVERW